MMMIIKHQRKIFVGFTLSFYAVLLLFNRHHQAQTGDLARNLGLEAGQWLLNVNRSLGGIWEVRVAILTILVSYRQRGAKIDVSMTRMDLRSLGPGVSGYRYDTRTLLARLK